MAKTLMATARSYIVCSSRTNLLVRFFSQSPKHFAPQRTQHSYMFLSCSNNNEKAKSLVYSDGRSNKIDRYLVGNRRFSSKATHVNDAGSIDQPLMQSMETKIKEHLNAESVSVKDMSGDGRHVCIDVVSEAFEGQSSVNRQRMVYKAIWEELQNTVHAVDQMTTRTPSEAK